MAYNKNEYQREYMKRTQYASTKKWLETNDIRNISLRINAGKHPDVIAALESVPNKSAYIISLIEADIENNPKI